MYTYLSTVGDCYYIQYCGMLVGDVSLQDSGEISIVVCKEFQNVHIGRRCIIDMLALLKRHCGSMSELTDVEWDELRKLVCKVESCLKATLGATLCNWSCLMNSFYKEAAPDPHLHIHVRPRYDKPVMLNGNTYSDSEFGHHYALNKSGIIPAEDKEEVFIRLKEWLNR